MSFQDFGSRSSTASRPTPLGGRPSATGAATMGQGALNQISESLLQYQRNVGILEKIVQSLTKTTTNSNKASFRDNNKDELELQYRAQADVITQLGQKVHDLIHLHRQQQSSGTGTTADSVLKTTLIKLERDFDRVQKQATALTQTVDRLRQQQQQKLSAVHQESSSSSGAAAYEQYQQQMQVQLEEDRLAEQIMREREDEIRQINRGMHQVNEIYKDLAHIVASQQDQVDAIETQMEESRANADSGLKQIEKANEKYGSSNCVIS
ncbi:hypothetical protein ACA910_003260 [Epithemia clementina (nom. ined.)]